MKTNHRRGFIGKRPRDQAMFSTGAYAPLSGRRTCAAIGNDFSNGHRGMAKAKAGAKKYVRTRNRFHENAAARRMALREEE